MMLSQDEIALAAASQRPALFEYLSAAIAELLPRERIEVVDGNIVACRGFLVLTPAAYKVVKIGGEFEEVGWQVEKGRYYYATRHQPEEIDFATVHPAAPWRHAATLFLVELFRTTLAAYNEQLADAAAAEAWNSGEFF